MEPGNSSNTNKLSPIYENVGQTDQKDKYEKKDKLFKEINKIIQNQQHTNQQILNLEERSRLSTTQMQNMELLVASIIQVISNMQRTNYSDEKEQKLDTQIRNRITEIEGILQTIANKITTDVSSELERGINLLRKLRLQESFVEKKTALTEQQKENHHIKHLIENLEKQLNKLCFTV